MYSALQTHLIEGAENNWRTYHSSRHFEVARHWSGSHHSYSPEALLISADTLARMSSDDRDLLVQLGRDSVPYMRELWDRMEEDSRRQVLAAGVQANDVDVAAFHRAARPMLVKYLQGSGLRELYDSIRALA